jgi:hypothetical protein
MLNSSGFARQRTARREDGPLRTFRVAQRAIFFYLAHCRRD